MEIEAIKYNMKLLSGSSYLDAITVSYDTLVRLFGEPHLSQDSKTCFEWHVQVGGCVHAIYDYKGSKQWHIGGFSRANFVKELKEYILQNS
jgi:hypothetical protein